MIIYRMKKVFKGDTYDILLFSFKDTKKHNYDKPAIYAWDISKEIAEINYMINNKFHKTGRFSRVVYSYEIIKNCFIYGLYHRLSNPSLLRYINVFKHCRGYNHIEMHNILLDKKYYKHNNYTRHYGPSHQE